MKLIFLKMEGFLFRLALTMAVWAVPGKQRIGPFPIPKPKLLHSFGSWNSQE